MLKKNDLIALGKTLAKADRNSKTAYSFGKESFSYEDLDDTFRNEMNELASTYSNYRENKNLIFSVMEETIDDYLPRKVLEQYGMFAEVKTFNQGDKPIFIQKITNAAKRRAKQFITKVGLAGVYEVFKLDGKSYEIPTSAFGGAAQIGIEEFLDKRIEFSDVLDILMEGLDECIYIEIERALKGAVTKLQTSNKTSQTAFVEAEMDRLLAIADSYGQTTIYCTYEFAATMVPSTGWVSDEMRNQKWQNGYLANYKNHKVIVMPQSYEDETNEVKVIDPSYAWLIPSSNGDKPIKIAFEGGTIVKESENDDLSREIQAYKKVGVGSVITNNLCVYVNTALK